MGKIDKPGNFLLDQDFLQLVVDSLKSKDFQRIQQRISDKKKKFFDRVRDILKDDSLHVPNVFRREVFLSVQDYILQQCEITLLSSEASDPQSSKAKGSPVELDRSVLKKIVEGKIEMTKENHQLYASISSRLEEVRSTLAGLDISQLGWKDEDILKDPETFESGKLIESLSTLMDLMTQHLDSYTFKQKDELLPAFLRDHIKGHVSKDFKGDSTTLDRQINDYILNASFFKNLRKADEMSSFEKYFNKIAHAIFELRPEMRDGLQAIEKLVRNLFIDKKMDNLISDDFRSELKASFESHKEVRDTKGRIKALKTNLEEDFAGVFASIEFDHLPLTALHSSLLEVESDISSKLENNGLKFEIPDLALDAELKNISLEYQKAFQLFLDKLSGMTFDLDDAHENLEQSKSFVLKYVLVFAAFISLVSFILFHFEGNDDTSQSLKTSPPRKSSLPEKKKAYLFAHEGKGRSGFNGPQSEHFVEVLNGKPIRRTYYMYRNLLTPKNQDLIKVNAHNYKRVSAMERSGFYIKEANIHVFVMTSKDGKILPKHERKIFVRIYSLLHKKIFHVASSELAPVPGTRLQKFAYNVYETTLNKEDDGKTYLYDNKYFDSLSPSGAQRNPMNRRVTYYYDSEKTGYTDHMIGNDAVSVSISWCQDILRRYGK